MKESGEAEAAEAAEAERDKCPREKESGRARADGRRRGRRGCEAASRTRIEEGRALEQQSSCVQCELARSQLIVMPSTVLIGGRDCDGTYPAMLLN